MQNICQIIPKPCVEQIKCKQFICIPKDNSILLYEEALLH